MWLMRSNGRAYVRTWSKVEAMMEVEDNHREARGPVASDKAVLWILLALVLTGLAAGYHWWRALPR